MSSLSKKILFFFILSMMCNSILSACINNVYYAFLRKNSTPQIDFCIALIAYSQSLLRSDNLNNLFSYYNGYENYSNNTSFPLYTDNTIQWTFAKTHNQVLDYLNSIGSDHNRGASRSASPYIVNETVIIKRDVDGYFRFLIKKFEKYGRSVDLYITNPLSFCQTNYPNNFPDCGEALFIMFRLKDDQIRAGDILRMKAVDSLRFVYLHYTYVDFTPQIIFPNPNNRAIDQNEANRNILLISIMANFFMIVTNSSPALIEELGPNFFPSIEYYCSLLPEERL